MPYFASIIATYAARNVWSADESYCFYCKQPALEMLKEPASIFKNRLTRAMLFNCCNSDGRELALLRIVGRAWKPRTFNGKSDDELGSACLATQNILMTKALFCKWYARPHHYSKCPEERKMVLLVDNCSAHGKKKSLLLLSFQFSSFASSYQQQSTTFRLCCCRPVQDTVERPSLVPRVSEYR